MARSTTDRDPRQFRALHVPGTPLVMPNAWDAGSAKLFASLGFAAIATTSSGFAATLGRARRRRSRRDEALAHTADLAAATALPVNADLEDCFADDPAGVAATITAAVDAGAAGASVEDYAATRRRRSTRSALATERVAAAVEAARAGGLVLTARAENLIRGVQRPRRHDRRLQAYQEAGADVLYAPGLFTIDDVARRRHVGRPAGQRAAARRRPGRRRRSPPPASPGCRSAGRWRGWRGAPSPHAAGELLATGTQGYGALATAGGKAARAALG